MDTKKYKIGIIGAGAIGTTLAYGLNTLSYPTLFSSKGPLGKDEFRYLTIKDKKEKIISCPNEVEDLECIFVCTKIYNIRKAIERYIDRISDRCPIILVCNGFVLDIVKELKLKYPTKIFRISYIDTGVSSTGVHEYVIKSSSSYMIWGPSSNLDRFYNYKSSFENLLDGTNLLDLGISFKYSNEAIDYNHKKWIFNTTLNPFCVYKNCKTNKEVLNYFDSFKKTFDEVFELSTVLFNKSLDKKPVFKELRSLIDRTAMNRNSMVSDVVLKKKTENDFLSGMCKNLDKYPLLTKINSFIQKLDT